MRAPRTTATGNVTIGPPAQPQAGVMHKQYFGYEFSGQDWRCNGNLIINVEWPIAVTNKAPGERRRTITSSSAGPLTFQSQPSRSSSWSAAGLGRCIASAQQLLRRRRWS
jgi:hypothetical protein